MLDTQSRPASAGSLARTGRQQELGAYLDHNRYGMPSQAPAYGPGNFDARRTMSYVFHLRSATASFGDGGSRVSAGSNAGVTDLSPEDSEFHQFVKDIFGQPVDAGRGSAQQAAAEATTGFQPVRFAAASTDADAIMADNVPHHGQDASDTGSPGSQISQQETSPAQFLNAEDWADHMVLDAPLQQLPLHPNNSVHPHPPSHQISEHLKSLQEGTRVEQSPTHFHPPPVQSDNVSIAASCSGHTNALKAPGVSDADCQHQELMQTPDAALDDGCDDDWYDKLHSLDSSDSNSSHYSMGDDSPLGRLADSGCDCNPALNAAFPATPPAHQVYSRAQVLNAVDKILEADVAPQLNSTYAQPAQEQVLQPPAVVHRPYVVSTMDHSVNGHKSRKRPMTTEEQLPEAVQLHNSRHVMTRPTASSTAVNKPHAVLPHHHELQQNSAAAHFNPGVQHHEHEPVQQAQADAMSLARGEVPRRKRRKTAGIPFSAAHLTLPTALSTAAATQAASAHSPMPDEASATAATTAPAAASTPASAA